MAKWDKVKIVDAPKPYHGIHCFTCKSNLPGKSALKLHMGHDVHYVDINGQIEG